MSIIGAAATEIKSTGVLLGLDQELSKHDTTAIKATAIDVDGDVSMGVPGLEDLLPQLRSRVFAGCRS